MTAYRGAFPYLEGDDRLADIPDYSDELAQLLDLPAPRTSNTAGVTATLPANVSSWTTVPGIQTGFAVYLDVPTYCLCSFTGYVEGTASAFHYLRLRVTDSANNVITPEGNGEIGLWKNTAWTPLTISRVLLLQPGGSNARVQVDYKTPASTVAKINYGRTEIFPIRAA